MLWLPLFIALLSVGFAKLSIVTVNWFFGHRLTKRIIVTLHSINFSLILGFPLLLAYGPGGCPLRLVLDRQWQLVPFFLLAGSDIGRLRFYSIGLGGDRLPTDDCAELPDR